MYRTSICWYRLNSSTTIMIIQSDEYVFSPETFCDPASPLFVWDSKNRSVKSRMLSGSNVNRCSSIISCTNWRKSTKYFHVRAALLYETQETQMKNVSMNTHPLIAIWISNTYYIGKDFRWCYLPNNAYNVGFWTLIHTPANILAIWSTPGITFGTV